MKKTLVIGASEKSDRYSNKAVRKLVASNHSVLAYGNKAGRIGKVPIVIGWPHKNENIHTISLYIRDVYQKDIYEKILALNPQRIIFNPGTENPELYRLAKEKGVEVLNACTLVMLSIGDF